MSTADSPLIILDLLRKQVICSFEVPVKFFTLHVITSQDRQSLSIRTDPGFCLTQQKAGSATELLFT